MDANLEALEDLKRNLKELGVDFMELPYVLQLNKRDLRNIVPAQEMKAQLTLKNEPVFEAIAKEGRGVLETLQGVGRQVLAQLRKG